MLNINDNEEEKSSYHSLLPIYPLLAQQCVDDYRLENGICIDIGTGNGYMGTEIAKITHMSIFYVDIEPKGLEFARHTVEEANIDNEVSFVEADVCRQLPFKDNFADFIISRGSLWFWEDRVKGIAEVYRVLKMGGKALIGGGLGRYLPGSMRARLMEGRKNMLEKKGVKKPSGKELQDMALQAGILSFKILRDSPEQKTGTWIEIHKYVEKVG